MTKKDFILIARVVNDSRGFTDSESVDYIAQSFAKELASTNPLFDRERFLAACGVR